MDLNSTGSSDPTRPAPAGVPYLSATQATTLLRSGLAIASEMIDNAFESVSHAVQESLESKWDFGVGVPLVQRLLHNKRSELRSNFMRHLKEQQDRVLEQALMRNIPSPKGTVMQLSADTLSLVDAVTATSSAVVDRAASKMRGVMEDTQRDLHVVVSHLVGRTTLRQGDDPFGPEVFMHALLTAAEDLSLHAEAWDLLLQIFERPMADEIGRIHLQLLEHFQRHGIDVRAIRRELAARQAVARGLSGNTIPGGPELGGRTVTGAPTQPAFGPQGYAPGTALAGAGSIFAPQGAMSVGAPAADPGLVLNNLMARLQANARDYRPPQLPSPGPAGAPLLEALNELQHLGLQGVAGASFAGSQAGSINTWREHLIEKSSRTVDKLTIEIVGMMFDQVLRDAQVPAEIKAILSRLQFPVLKAALLDADFFASNTHPARRLIDRIANTATGWEPYGDENERYRAEVERIVRTVLEQFDRDLAIFERLLGEFENFVGDIAPRDSDPVARAKRALEEAEKREILAINTTIQVRRAFEKVELEPYLRDFLVGPWVQVLVSAILREDQTPGFSKSFREVIGDVVWSVQPKATADERKRLVTMIPNLSRVLRDGLALIRMSEREQQTFFQQLMASHAVAVKPVDQATYIKSSVATSELRSRMDNMQITGSFPITTVAGGIRVSTGAVMRAAADHNADVVMPGAVTDIGNLDRVEEAAYDEQISSFQRGTWFSIWNGTEMLKVRLRWISPLRTLFMFSSDKDNQAHVLPPDVLKSYLKRGYLKQLDSGSLTKRAVDGVVGEFEKMPKRAEELAARYMPA